jgi:hypothetical protein
MPFPYIGARESRSNACRLAEIKPPVLRRAFVAGQPFVSDAASFTTPYNLIRRQKPAKVNSGNRRE